MCIKPYIYRISRLDLSGSRSDEGQVKNVFTRFDTGNVDMILDEHYENTPIQIYRKFHL